MQIVGLTGNIGSGKSTVGRVFQSLGIPVFNSDNEAKKAYSLISIQNEVNEILGAEIDFSKETWKEQIADSIFSDPLKRQNLETLIHGYVQHKFQEWKSDQNSAYIIREAALASSFSPNNT
ncbi:MAG: dephospho-CoA kinase, partial [Bacteroidota bacterium]